MQLHACLRPCTPCVLPFPCRRPSYSWRRLRLGIAAATRTGGSGGNQPGVGAQGRKAKPKHDGAANGTRSSGVAESMQSHGAAQATELRKNPELYAGLVSHQDTAAPSSSQARPQHGSPSGAAAAAANHPASPTPGGSSRRPPPVLPAAKPEVLSPAGGWPQLKAAVENGADAVYLGLDDFNARARAENFTLDSLPEVMTFLHDRGVKGYVVLNVLIFDEELPKAEAYARAIAQAGVDAVIVQVLLHCVQLMLLHCAVALCRCCEVLFAVAPTAASHFPCCPSAQSEGRRLSSIVFVQDLGLVALLRRVAPGLPVHGSTQMSITSGEGAQFAAAMGVERVVVGRELSVAEIGAVRAGKRVGGARWVPALQEWGFDCRT